jgi:hypothetical protein
LTPHLRFLGKHALAAGDLDLALTLLVRATEIAIADGDPDQARSVCTAASRVLDQQSALQTTAAATAATADDGGAGGAGGAGGLSTVDQVGRVTSAAVEVPVAAVDALLNCCSARRCFITKCSGHYSR